MNHDGVFKKKPVAFQKILAVMGVMDAHQSQEQDLHLIPEFDFRRLRAALVLRQSSVEAIARATNYSSRHVWHVLAHKRRPPARLLNYIRETLGTDGWAFITGQTDDLRDHGASHGAA